MRDLASACLQVARARLGDGRLPHAGDVERSVRLLLAPALGLAAVTIGGLLVTRHSG